jgi:predicted O-linked N-acetylglucosamine transferase (SPINDLY family)
LNLENLLDAANKLDAATKLNEGAAAAVEGDCTEELNNSKESMDSESLAEQVLTSSCLLAASGGGEGAAAAVEGDGTEELNRSMDSAEQVLTDSWSLAASEGGEGAAAAVEGGGATERDKEKLHISEAAEGDAAPNAAATAAPLPLGPASDAPNLSVDSEGAAAAAAAAAGGSGTHGGSASLDAAAWSSLDQAADACSMCRISNPGDGLILCLQCRSSICSVCASLIPDLQATVKMFLNRAPQKAWADLGCLQCQSVERYDELLSLCLQDVTEAVTQSQKQKPTANSNHLRHYVGIIFANAPYAGLFAPKPFCDGVAEMVKYELEQKKECSVSPWEAQFHSEFDRQFVLNISCNAAGQKSKKIPKLGQLREIDEANKFTVLFFSSDIGDHPTAHLMTGELMAMSKMDGVVVYVMCAADKERLVELGPESRCRTELKKCFGDRFLECGSLKDARISAEISKINPHCVYLAGFHQEADRIGALQRIETRNFIIVQTVAHAGPTGSQGVEFILCNNRALPEEIQQYFIEKFLYIDDTFLPNSFRELFDEDAENLKQLRENPVVREGERKKLGLPSGKLLVNISKANRFNQEFFDLIFRVLKANQDAVLILIDHEEYPAFKKRTKARFKKEGLENKILFVPFQSLQTGALHRFLGVCDVYVDTTRYNSHTAFQDLLWALGVGVTVQGDTLASRIAADLNEKFGTPENTFLDTEAAFQRLDQLVKNPELLCEARVKGEKCRRDSLMYDNAKRAKSVINALLSGYNKKRSEQQEKQLIEQKNIALQREFSEQDITDFAAVLHSLGVETVGSLKRNDLTSMIPAKFRGVNVTVIFANQLDMDPANNPLFREVVGRDFISHEFGVQIWPEFLPFDETCITEGGDPKLDVMTVLVRDRKAHAVIQEETAGLAGEKLLDLLALKWIEAKPNNLTIDCTTSCLHAIIKLLSCVHARGRSHGGEPRDFNLSHLQDGHGKEAAAYVSLPDGEIFALLLGSAEFLLDPVHEFNSHLLDCQKSQDLEMVQARNGTETAKKRSSTRRLEQNISIPSDEIKSQLPKRAQSDPCIWSCCSGSNNIILAQREDIRRAAQAILNAMLGITGKRTVVHEKWKKECTSIALLREWLEKVSEECFRNMTGLSNKKILNETEIKQNDLLTELLQKHQNLKKLLDLLAKMLSVEALDSAEILRGFSDIALPRKAYCEGLVSAPENMREKMIQCRDLKKNLVPNSIHYFVSRRENYVLNQKHTKLISVWLVYTRSDPSKRWYRSVRAAEIGNPGEIGAIYSARIEWDETMLNRTDITYCMQLPNVGRVPCIEAKPRGILAAPEYVAKSHVAMFVNSSLDELGQSTRTANCNRVWDPVWTRFGTQRDVSAIPRDAKMCLILCRQVLAYDELLYPYQWGKTEVRSGKRKKVGPR